MCDGWEVGADFRGFGDVLTGGMGNGDNSGMDKPTLIITGTPDWAEAVSRQLAGDYRVEQYMARAPGYITRLTDDRAVLILVDGDSADWRFWTTTPKVSPATRRTPIIVVAGDESVRADAPTAGADVVLTPGELLGQVSALVKNMARVPDVAFEAQLDDECGGELPELAKQGIEKFNAGEYYRQHDLFEALWMQTESPVRNLYQAILQVGIAYYQITLGNHRGAMKMLLRAAQWLSMLPDVCQGVDVRQLRADAARVRAELERLAPEDIGMFDRGLLKPVQLKGEQHGR